MTGLIGKATNDPQTVGGAFTQDEREAQWGAMAGEIVSYDAARGTATVKPLQKVRVLGKLIEPPVLEDVPIDFPRSGNAGLTFPVPAGTRVMLRPMMRSMENYDEEDVADPSDGRSFALSDMRATITGGDSLAAPMPNVDAENTHLRTDPDGRYGFKGSPDGRIKIEGAEGNIYDLLATVVELLASDGLNVLSGSSVGNGIHELQHRAQYTEIAAKLRAMAL